MELFIPPIKLCTDNAAMIGAAASILYEEKRLTGWDLNAKPSLPLM